MKKILLILLFVPMLLSAQNKLSPYTRIFLEERKHAQTEAQKASIKKQFAVRSVEESEEEYISGFLLIKSGYNTEELEAMGVRINTDLDSIFTAEIPLSQLDAIMSLDYVKRFEMGTPMLPTMKIARPLANVDAVHKGEGGLPQGYTGKNTVVGIIDIGLQYNHINFFTKDRKDLRVKYVWNQSATGSAATRPEGFSYGREYKTKASILAARQDNSGETHGTHVAGIAAGATSFLNECGVAPDADIIMVSVGNRNSAILDGIKYCFDRANDKPCVVNISWGSHSGPHDGTSTFDKACEALVGQKKILVGSAGNEGSDYLHCSKHITATDSELKTVLGGNQGYLWVDVWGHVAQSYQLQICVFDSKGNAVFESSTIETANNINKNETYSITSGGTGTCTCVSEWNNTNNKGNIAIYSTNLTLKENHYLGLKITSTTEGTINAWLNNTQGSWYFYPNSFDGFVGGDNVSSVGEIGGTGKRIISVGSFNSTSISGYETKEYLSSFSSKGPTADGRTKPDVIAPGCQIYSSVNSYEVTNNTMGDFGVTGPLLTQTIKGVAGIANGTECRYGKLQGTSMSAPFVAGVIALWLENARWMDPEQVKDVLSKTCTTDDKVGTNPNEVGYGKIDALAGLIETFKFSSLEEIEASDAQLICYPNPVVDQLRVFFPKTDKNVNISVWNANGQLVEMRQIDKIANLQEETIDFAAMPSGLYIVRVAGDKTHETFKIQK